MFFSKSIFFKQRPNALLAKRYDVFSLLTMKGYNRRQIDIYLNAYDYFVNNPNDFDGATFVKDLIDVRGLDLDAMLHDYQYLKYNVASNIKIKFLTDLLYAKGIEKKGKSQYAAYSRFFGLTALVGIPIMIYSLIKRGFTTDSQKKQFLKDYKILTNKSTQTYVWKKN